MQSNDQDPPAAGRQSQALELISAIAQGDAKAEEIATRLRQEGFDALDVVLALVARASATSRRHNRAQRTIDLRHFSKPTPPDLVARTVHRVPKFPFILNGTLYDPQDIRRFDGRELHLIATAAGEPILAVDDRGVMARWWELTYLSSLSSAAQNYQYGGYQFGAGPQDDGPTIVVTPPPFTQGSHGGGVNETFFFEDINFQGDTLTLAANRGYYDLTEVHRGFLGLGDWNDIISSLQMIGTTVCVLHEDIHWEGSTLTFSGGMTGTSDLDGLGWNDRASSLETW